MEQNVELTHLFTGLTKSTLSNMAAAVVEHILEKGAPERIAEQLSAMETYIKAIKADERFVSYVREELTKNGGKLTTSSGAKIEVSEAGVVYDYSYDNHWCALHQNMKLWEQKLKAHEEKLKRIPAGKLLVDEETGETFTGPYKTSKSTYKITLAK